MIDRIKTLIEKQNLTATQFAEEVGVQRSAVSHLLSGRNKPSLDFMLKIKNRFPDISLDWLLLGQGKMTEMKPEESKLVENRQTGLFQSESKPISEEAVDENARIAEADIPVGAGKTALESLGKEAIVESSENLQKVIFIYPDNTFKVFDTR